MQHTPQLFHSFGYYLKQQFGRKIRKLSLHGDFSCPNRDGTLGRGGCTFCNVASFVDETARAAPISQQLQLREQELKRKADAYLAYFQAYTSTYGEQVQLQKLYDQALAAKDIVGLCVGTRPDCVPDGVLGMLAEYQAQGQEIWLELGLQTANDQTLKRINRGHDFAAYQDAVARAKHYGLKVCTHLIVGLPGEDQQDALQTLDKVLMVGVDGLKLHPLHIVEGSVMAKAWRADRLATISLESYAETAAKMIQATPAQVVFHRVSAHARPPTLLAPDWCEDRWLGPQAIQAILAAEGGQGSATAAPFRAALPESI
ncbi:TIGR01212 family radical SAM protein [Corallincola spongiicola]|uniref:TIGR01212 family radical SAM protein n=1 Tax=Corallincola spongiicola TaxID=2520508 RepID=A0ABY1WNE4_9GAMM|nr:TIGR01212 family radical SAM protein [Corallincola spongiicola]TAA45087.1 TIGR01212 family radical SAM protein [Corallincola spongiicola]